MFKEYVYLKNSEGWGRDKEKKRRLRKTPQTLQEL